LALRCIDTGFRNVAEQIDLSIERAQHPAEMLLRHAPKQRDIED